MKFTDMTPQQQNRSITTMGRCGGGFAGKLADAWNVADGTNAAKLASAFSDLVERFGPDSDFYTYDDKVVCRKSFKPVVKIIGEGDKWCGNALRFATSEEAAASAADLASRWIMVAEHGVQESTDPVTHVMTKLGNSIWLMGEVK